MQRLDGLFLFAAFAALLGTIPTIFFSAHGQQINTGNIANNAVTSPKIRDGEVKTPDISSNAVTSSKISDGAVGESELQDDSVTSAKIQDGSILSRDLAPGLLEPANDILKGVTAIIFKTCALDFPSIGAQERSFASCPVSGARVGDKVIITNQDTGTDLITQSASVNSTDLVKIAVKNPTFIPINPPKINWAMIIFRPST